MKPILPVLALLASSAFPMGANLGADLSGILTFPDNTPSNIDGKLGFGVRAVPTLELSLNDYLALRGSAGYELTTWGTKSSGDVLGVGYSSDSSVVSQFLTFGVAGEVYILPGLAYVSAGPSVDIPLHSQYTYKQSLAGVSTTTNGDITGDQNSVFLDLGAGVQLTPSFGIFGAYRLPMVPYYDKNNETNKLRQISLGFRFTLL